MIKLALSRKREDAKASSPNTSEECHFLLGDIMIRHKFPKGNKFGHKFQKGYIPWHKGKILVPHKDGKKPCPKCKRLKPLSEFYKKSASQDGLTSWCKGCYRELNRTEHRKQYCNQWRIKSGYDSKGFARIRRNAKQRVIGAVKSGRLKKLSCEICGDTNVQGHHKDYSKPLEVVWLCEPHHIEWHKNNNYAIFKAQEE